MQLSKAARVLSFFGALAIGVAGAYVAGSRAEEPVYLTEEPVAVEVSYTLSPIPPAKAVPVRAENLLGVWTGTWGYGREHCTIEIERVDGETFHGTLRKEGAVITLAGTLDPDGRRVFFRETKVLKLGPDMSEWSLGTNNGSFSPDGRTLTGVGIDKWGAYGWDASKD